MSTRSVEGWLYRWSGGLLAAKLVVVAPLLATAHAQQFNPFQNQNATTREAPTPPRRAAPRRPEPPSLPERKRAVPTAPAEVSAVSATPQEAPSEVSAGPNATPAAPSARPAQDAVALSSPEEVPAANAERPAASADVPAPADEKTEAPIGAKLEEDSDVVQDDATPASTPEAVETLPLHPVRNPVRSGSDPNAAAHPKVVAALEQCVELLDGLHLEYEHLDSIRRGPCGTTAPIKLKSIGKNPKIAVSPPATVNCTVAATLHEWFETSVQPTAEALGTSVVKIKNAASYMCRNQYGRSDTKLSEHAKANALDIKAFVLASGQTIPILGNWPYGYRPTRPRLADAPWPNPLRPHSSLKAAVYKSPGLSSADETLDHERFTEEAEEFSSMATHPFFKPMFVAPAEILMPEEEEPEGPVPEGNISRKEAKAFLRTIHGDACKIFWTVLGPEANAAHRDHFHFDMRKRRYVRICQ